MNPQRLDATGVRSAAFRLVGDRPGWQTRFAALLGVHKATISRWVSGQARLSGTAHTAITALLEAQHEQDHGTDH